MGLGRTGAPFAIQHWGVEPDIITTAKVPPSSFFSLLVDRRLVLTPCAAAAQGLCAGYGVLAAVIVAGPLCRTIAAGSGAHTQGHTHTANPLSCAAAAAVLDYINEQRVVDTAAARGEYLGAALQQQLGDSPIVGDIRGRGMFWGVELVSDKETKAPFDVSLGLTARIVAAGMASGIMLVGGSPGCADGVNGDQLQLSPPLVMTEAQIDHAVGLLAGAIETARLEVEAEVAAEASSS